MHIKQLLLLTILMAISSLASANILSSEQFENLSVSDLNNYSNATYRNCTETQTQTICIYDSNQIIKRQNNTYSVLKKIYIFSISAKELNQFKIKKGLIYADYIFQNRKARSINFQTQMNLNKINTLKNSITKIKK